MRTLLKVSMPVEPANKAIKDGDLPKLFQRVADQLRPEACYFYAENGKRTALMVFDLKEPAQIPLVAEQFFNELNASVELSPVMNIEEVKKGLEKYQREAGRVPVGA